MRLARILLIVAMASLPLVASAVDLDLGLEVDGVYDSNVYRTSENQVQDGSFRFTPTVRIDVPGKKFSGNLFFAPTYEVFTTQSQANGFTYDVSNQLYWVPDEKTDISLVSRFRSLDVLNGGDPNTIDEGTTPIPDKDISRARTYLFGTALSVAHAISSRWDSNTSIDYNSFDSKRRLTADSKSVGVFQDFDYGLTASDRIGAGGGVNVQLFDEVKGLPASNTYVYQLFANYSRNFGERTILSLRVGPAMIHTIQDPFERTSTQNTYPHLDYPLDGGVLGVDVPEPNDCLQGGNGPVLLEGSRCALKRRLLYVPGLDPINGTINAIRNSQSEVILAGSNEGSNDMRWTIFGEIALTHFWLPTLSQTISYNRRESPANGQGASTVADSVYFRTIWQPSELWDLSLLASYVRRESPTNLSRSFLVVEGEDFGAAGGIIVRSSSLKTVVEKSSAVDTHRFAVTLRAARRITQRMSSSIRVGYSDQRSKHTSRSPNDFGNFLAIVGVKYDFDPFRF
jgi:hypothetical protein